MIQINLLGVPKPKKGKRASVSMPSMAGEGANPVLLLGAALVVAVIALGIWFMMVNRETERIAQETAAAQKESQRLAVAKAKYEEKEAQRQNFEQRVKVIQDLQAKQAGPVELLAMVGDAVNSTEGVWLNTLKEDGRNVNIDGMALSVHQVATLMKTLQTTGFFKSVELKETVQDDQIKDMQAFAFSLVAEKAEKKL